MQAHDCFPAHVRQIGASPAAAKVQRREIYLCTAFVSLEQATQLCVASAHLVGRYLCLAIEGRWLSAAAMENFNALTSHPSDDLTMPAYLTDTFGRKQ